MTALRSQNTTKADTKHKKRYNSRCMGQVHGIGARDSYRVREHVAIGACTDAETDTKSSLHSKHVCKVATGQD